MPEYCKKTEYCKIPEYRIVLECCIVLEYKMREYYKKPDSGISQKPKAKSTQWEWRVL